MQALLKECGWVKGSAKAYLDHISLPEMYFLNYSSASFGRVRICFRYGNEMLKLPLIFLNVTLFYSLSTKRFMQRCDLCVRLLLFPSILWVCWPFTTTFLREAEVWKVLCFDKHGKVGGQTKVRDSLTAPLKAEKLKHKFKSYHTAEKPHGWVPRSNDLTVGSISAGLYTLGDVK